MANQGRQIRNIFKLAGILLCFLFIFPLEALALDADLGYPKIANVFLKWGISEEEAKELSRWDLVVIDMEAQVYTPGELKKLREYNPRIIILAYVTAQEIRSDAAGLEGTLRQKLFSGISDSWWLRNARGEKISWWPDTWLLNVSDDCPLVSDKRWNNYLTEFVHQEVMSSGLWDGIFYDNTWNDIGWLRNSSEIDINNDGRADTAQFLNSRWQEGMAKLLRQSRAAEGEKYIIGNGGSAYREIINGSLLEHFPYTIENDWAKTLAEYFLINDEGKEPRINIINSNTGNTGNKEDYRHFRFGLVSTLLGNGYYSFDFGDREHSQLWWYDEYDIFLNVPVSDFYNVDNKDDKNFKDGVWQRDFKGGVALLNSGAEPRTVKLAGEFEKIKGTEDLETNDGQIVSEVELPPLDGLLLLRPLDKIIGAPFVNASFAKIFNRNGKSIRNGFFAYEGDFKGGSKIIIKDLDGDKKNEFIVADKNKVAIYGSDKVLAASFYPYGGKYDKGINIALGDLDNDGQEEIITGTEAGAGPQVRIFNRSGRPLTPGFFAFDKKLRGGVNVAVGDLDGDGKKEIVAGAGAGGAPQVRVFNKDGKLLSKEFFAYNAGFRGGVNVAVGDLNGDNLAEIITGPGAGGGPQVRVFNKDGKMLSAGFFTSDSKLRSGVKVVSSDVDGDGKDEIIALTTDPFTLSSLIKE
ncbi:MAG: putative glycoside hydrolase [Patescibacteria group bacterium]|nr:putative glycoside hydrolase [Patescibacteria group bacterium]MDD5490744.1 putative glycoside hydrolase [Patescibacteria group bacterium]